MTISGIDITITEPEEIMGFGGPYIGNLFFGKELISKGCIVGNFIYKEGSELLFFVKHHLIGNHHYFAIGFFNRTDRRVFEFAREFDMVYLKGFVSDNELEIYLAFHDKIESTKLVFNLDNEDFSPVVS